MENIIKVIKNWISSPGFQDNSTVIIILFTSVSLMLAVNNWWKLKPNVSIVDVNFRDNHISKDKDLIHIAFRLNYLIRNNSDSSNTIIKRKYYVQGLSKIIEQQFILEIPGKTTRKTGDEASLFLKIPYNSSKRNYFITIELIDQHNKSYFAKIRFGFPEWIIE